MSRADCPILITLGGGFEKAMDGLGDVLAALDDRFGEIAVLPVHGRAGKPAIRVLVRARKGSRAPLTLLPGLMLNDEDGRPTDAAEAVLRDGEALPMTAD